MINLYMGLRSESTLQTTFSHPTVMNLNGKVFNLIMLLRLRMMVWHRPIFISAILTEVLLLVFMWKKMVITWLAENLTLPTKPRLLLTGRLISDWERNSKREKPGLSLVGM